MNNNIKMMMPEEYTDMHDGEIGLTAGCNMGCDFCPMTHVFPTIKPTGQKEQIAVNYKKIISRGYFRTVVEVTPQIETYDENGNFAGSRGNGEPYTTSELTTKGIVAVAGGSVVGAIGLGFGIAALCGAFKK